MGNREDLLAAAERCLRAKGYSATTSRDLASEGGTSLAAIGYHFGSKEALLNEAMTKCFSAWSENLGARLLALVGLPREELMAQMLPAIYEAIETDRAVLVAFFDALAQSERSPELRALLVSQYQQGRAEVSALMGVLLGTDGTDADAQALAGLVVALLDGLAVQAIIDRSLLPATDAVRQLGNRLVRSR